MSIINYIREKKAKFQALQKEHQEAKLKSNAEKLTALKTESAKLEKQRIQERSIRAEKEKITKLRREPLDRTLEKLKGFKKAGNNPFKAPGNMFQNTSTGGVYAGSSNPRGVFGGSNSNIFELGNPKPKTKKYKKTVIIIK